MPRPAADVGYNQDPMLGAPPGSPATSSTCSTAAFRASLCS